VRECVEQWLEKEPPKKFETFEEVEKLVEVGPVGGQQRFAPAWPHTKLRPNKLSLLA
jgi:hypothetical protein